MKLSIIIPVFNEERTLRAILEKVVAVSLPNNLSKEIIIVNDASTDGTSAILKELKSRYGFVLLEHALNSGKGAAVKTGLMQSTGDYVVIQDADLEYNPADYPRLLAPFVDDSVDAVFGSRYTGKKIREVFSINYCANRVLTALSNLFTGLQLSDMETCYKVFTGKAARAIGGRMKARRFDMEPEITALSAQLGLCVVEVPVSYEARTAREGKKIKWSDGFPAVWSIVKNGTPCLWTARKWPCVFLASLLALIVLFGLYLGPNVMGDTNTYVDSINVLDGGDVPSGFIPNRILTTFLSMEIIRLIAPLFTPLFASSNMFGAWFFINSILYVVSATFMYKILVQLFGSKKVAYLGGLFLAANYGFLTFGLNYLMDIGGWTFYIISLYFLLLYAKSNGSIRPLMYSAIAIGIGGLFKEYAFLGCVAIAVFLIGELFMERVERGVWTKAGLWMFAKKALGAAAIAAAPVLLLYVYVYFKFDYTYADWFGYNQEYYVYVSRIKEYIKALGSLWNILGILFIGGLATLVWRWKKTMVTTKIFLLSVFASMLPIFFWPAITQRILFPTIPFAIIIAGFLFKKYEKYWYVFIPVLIGYVVLTFLMDSYLLTAINLPF